MQHHFRRWNLELRGGPGMASNWSPKLPRGVFCGAVREYSESAHESGTRGGPRSRTPQAPTRNSANPQA
eukprot:7200758-Alexandrium_andersonii.AAC.1